MEYKAAVDSGTIPLAEGDGVVTRVTAREVCVHYDNGTDKTYPLTKFMRSNQSTCINMRPIVDLGERVKAGDVLSDGPSTDQGEVALGKECPHRLHDLGRLQLRGTPLLLNEASGTRRRFYLPSISRYGSNPVIPSSDRGDHP